MLPFIKTTVPPELEIRPLADQSFFVRASINGVLKEASIAACLTGLMILLFLGSWRSTLIIAVSIPLSILASIAALSALGETINIMTLGGLALAVGILVDDATVTIENINRTLASGSDHEEAIITGAAQIALPALVSTLAICIVFVPMFLLTGVARYLFVPLAEAVIFAMLASYILSRTLVPTMAKYLLRAGGEHAGDGGTTTEAKRPPSRNPLIRLQHGFEHGFERFRTSYRGLLERCLRRRALFLLVFLGACTASIALLVPWLGQDFFPSVDSGQFTLHLRARTGTRIEETARLCDQVEQFIRQEIPPGDVKDVIDNIGLPYSGINLSYSNSAPTGPADADILVTLASTGKTAAVVHDLRLKLADKFPGVTFSFLASDITSQILNFGLPAPIDIQVTGQNQTGNRVVAAEAAVPAAGRARRRRPAHPAADRPAAAAHRRRPHQGESGRPHPARRRQQRADLAERQLPDLADVLAEPAERRQLPDRHADAAIPARPTCGSLENIPLTGAGSSNASLLASVGSIDRGAGTSLVSHYDIQPVIDIYGSVHGRDLGGVAAEIDRIVKDVQPDLPRGSRIIVRGQIQTMRASYVSLLSGLAFAIVLVYLLIVVNFQSWKDPFIIISALPAALAGIAWMLFVTHTTISVPALTGAIMCMGVATANSILVVAFAKERMNAGLDPGAAALEAGVHALPSGADDGAGDDLRHVADGGRAGRGRRAERAAGARGDRRPGAGDGRDAAVRPRVLQPAAPAAGAAPGGERVMTGKLAGRWRMAVLIVRVAVVLIALALIGGAAARARARTAGARDRADGDPDRRRASSPSARRRCAIWSCPPACAPTSKRRSSRARPDTSSAGGSTSARASRRATCWRRSTRRRSISSSARRARIWPPSRPT